MSLDDLYREVILDHYKRPRNRGDLENADAVVELHNPVCGDEIVLRAQFENGKVKSVRHEGRGCSISIASASMMSEILQGATVEQAMETVETFRAMMRGEVNGTVPESLGDLAALQGVSKYPVRIKCATLAWNAFEQALTEWRAR